MSSSGRCCSLSDSPRGRGPLLRHAETAIALAVLCLAAALRLYGIQRQGLTGDEYTIHYFTTGASLFEYLGLNAYRVPDNLPGYPALLYVWTQLLGTGVTKARLLAVLLGLVSCALVWRIGRLVSGCRTTGLVAALFYALSPLAIFHDQAVRPYPLFMALALLSVLCVAKLLLDGPRPGWLVASIVVNFLLVYTHLVSGVLLAAEGLLLCWAWRRDFRSLLLWTLPQLALVLPAPLFIHLPDTDPTYPPMHFTRYLLNLFHADTVDYSVELIASRENWGFTRVGYHNFRAATRVASILMGLFAIAGTTRIVQRIMKGGALPQANALLLIVIVFVVPGFLIYLASQVVDPMPLPRYMLYANAARMLLAAYGIAWIPFLLPRLAALGVLGAILVVQLSAIYPHGVRPEDRRMGYHIAEHAAPGDAVITALHPDMLYVHFPINGDLDRLTGNLMAFNLAVDLPIHREHSMYGMAEHAARLLQEQPATQNVWLVISRYFESGPIPYLEEQLKARALDFEEKSYYAFNAFSLYRVCRAANAAPSALPAPPYDVAALLQSWDITAPEGQSPESLLPDFLELFDGPPAELKRAGDYTALAFNFGSINPAMARAIAARGLRDFPQSDTLYLVDGLCALLAKENEAAMTSLTRARELLDRSMHATIGPVLDALLTGDAGLAAQRFNRLQEISGDMFDPLIGEAIEAARKD
jgi:4-amino-4-deoxy-L-arabinose transferase-like glycosyltransferase